MPEDGGFREGSGSLNALLLCDGFLLRPAGLRSAEHLFTALFGSHILGGSFSTLPSKLCEVVPNLLLGRHLIRTVT